MPGSPRGRCARAGAPGRPMFSSGSHPASKTTPAGPDPGLAHINRLPRDRDRWFESTSLQRRVSCEPTSRAKKRAVSKQWPLNEGPMVRILLPPGASPLRTTAGVELQADCLAGIRARNSPGRTTHPSFAGASRRLPAQRWERDGPLVATLRRQLGVITGKTHMVEFAFGGTGRNSHHGSPYNPWDAAAHRSVGGSSSGAGVSLLEGSALLACGSDTAG